MKLGGDPVESAVELFRDGPELASPSRELLVTWCGAQVDAHIRISAELQRLAARDHEKAVEVLGEPGRDAHHVRCGVRVDLQPERGSGEQRLSFP